MSNSYEYLISHQSWVTEWVAHIMSMSDSYSWYEWLKSVTHIISIMGNWMGNSCHEYESHMSHSYQVTHIKSMSHSYQVTHDMSHSYQYLVSYQSWVTEWVAHIMSMSDSYSWYESPISWVWVTHTHNVSYSFTYSWLMWYEVLIWVTRIVTQSNSEYEYHEYELLISLTHVVWVTHTHDDISNSHRMSDSYSWYEFLIYATHIIPIISNSMRNWMGNSCHENESLIWVTRIK